jgi:hypothetical protein
MRIFLGTEGTTPSAKFVSNESLPLRIPLFMVAMATTAIGLPLKFLKLFKVL